MQSTERASPFRHVEERHGNVAVRESAMSSESRRDYSRRPKTRQPEGFSADLTGRPYNVFQGEMASLFCFKSLLLSYYFARLTAIVDRWGSQDTVHGLLLPRDYVSAKAVGTGLPWVCPIRSCRSQFKRMSALGKHWKVCVLVPAPELVSQR